MSRGKTPIMILDDGTRVGPVAAVAEILGVASTELDQWIADRDRNGAPHPVDPAAGRNRSATYYDLDAWRAWKLTYTPPVGEAAAAPTDRQLITRPEA